MATQAVEPYTSRILSITARALASLGLTPNILSIIGVFLNAAVGYVLLEGRFFLGGWLYLVVSLTDMLDGILARQRNQVTRFGGFLDSVMDRFGDAAIFTGLILHYALIQNVPCVLLSTLALVGALVTSYTRARAECVIPKCKIGFMERPERVILLAIGLIFNRVPVCLLLMLIASVVIILNRISYTKQELQQHKETP